MEYPEVIPPRLKYASLKYKEGCGFAKCIFNLCHNCSGLIPTLDPTKSEEYAVLQAIRCPKAKTKLAIKRIKNCGVREDFDDFNAKKYRWEDKLIHVILPEYDVSSEDLKKTVLLAGKSGITCLYLPTRPFCRQLTEGGIDMDVVFQKINSIRLLVFDDFNYLFDKMKWLFPKFANVVYNRIDSGLTTIVRFTIPPSDLSSEEVSTIEKWQDHEPH